MKLFFIRNVTNLFYVHIYIFFKYKFSPLSAILPKMDVAPVAETVRVFCKIYEDGSFCYEDDRKGKKKRSQKTSNQIFIGLLLAYAKR